MSNLFLLALCFVLGVWLRHIGRFPENASATLNAFVINVALPALVLRHLHGVPIDSALLVAPLAAWMLLGFSAVFFSYAGRAGRLAPEVPAP